jgi:hypothetical protein
MGKNALLTDFIKAYGVGELKATQRQVICWGFVWGRGIKSGKTGDQGTDGRGQNFELRIFN